MDRWIVLIAVCGLMAACADEPGVSESDLLGKWEVVNAERRGKTTEIVNGAWFLFHKNGTMATNITGTVDSAGFALEGMNFSHHGKEQAVYHINAITAEEMTLSVELRNIPFKLTLEQTE